MDRGTRQCSDDPKGCEGSGRALEEEDGPLDDQNQGDGGARIVANDHPEDPVYSMLLRSFENGCLQRGRSQRRPKSKGTEETNSIKQCSQQFFSPIAKDYFEWLQSMEGKGGEKNNGIMKGIPYSDSNSREQVILLLRLDLFHEGRYGG